MRILIAGGTGFIGRHLVKARLQRGDQIYCYTRDADKVAGLFAGAVTPLTEFPSRNGLSMEAVINLAGEPIADKRWSAKRKQQLQTSRIDLTQQLVAWLASLAEKPKVLISGSAIGYYGNVAGEQALLESATASSGFTHHLCRDWENAALEAQALGVRVCLLRTGIVLGEGGALAKMYLPFKMGLGGPIGTGKQWMSWIHMADVVASIEMLLTRQDLAGEFNLTAPNAVTNKEFTKILGRTLHRPAFLPMPAAVIKLMLGEGAELLTGGQRVYPEKLLQAGYEFKFPLLSEALADIYS